MGIPVLGICYGLQALAHSLSPDSVEKADKREFGRAKILIEEENELLKDVRNGSVIWMSHGDHINNLPEEYKIIARTSNTPVAAVRHRNKQIYGVQFHQIGRASCRERG